ncbi:H-NS family nucleoid-associated regulatory protein [Fluviibacterium sp. S390]|uniref:H-NS histone family protein n=1 Tax=Fluviibacterium sp. S390 TaxID=3415139 RepID=UPI003C7A4021
MDIDLSELSLAELKSLHTKVGRAIETFEERRRKEAFAAAEATVREFGFSLNEVVDHAKKSGVSRPAKYRHPENPDLTWSGRGRQPQWFKDAIDGGASVDDLLIA